MKDILDILSVCRAKGINISLDTSGERLLLKGNVKDLEAAEKETIQQFKEDIVALLKKAKGSDYTQISPVPESDGYELSSAQKGLWMVSQLGSASAAYNIPLTVVFEGTLDETQLLASFHQLMEKHEILRTVFRYGTDDSIKQYVLPAGTSVFTIAGTDLRGSTDQETRVRELVQEVIAIPFDLSEGPLVRASLFRMAEDQWVFTFVMHHIISDAWSMDILIRDLLLFYHHANHAGPLRIQYKDYAAWQQSQLNTEALHAHAEYWAGQFEGELPVLQFYGDQVRPAMKTYNGGVFYKTLPAELSAGLKKIVQEQGATLFMGLIALVNALLYRYTSQDDIIIGTQIAGREHADLEDQLGCYLNTLALRTRFKGNDSFRDLMENVKAITLSAYQYQAYPFDELIETLQLRRDVSRNPLFDVSVVLQNASISPASQQQHIDGLQVKSFGNSESRISKFDLSFDFTETGDTIQTSLVYNSDIYHSSTAMQLINHLEQLLEALIHTPDKAICDVDYLTSAEKEQLLSGFNPIPVDYPHDRSIADLFEEQVRINPDGTAVVFQGHTLTFGELNAQADRLATWLLFNHDIKSGDFAGILLDRSELVIVAILGILKTGAAYVPIDPEYPESRQKFIMQDTGIKVLVTQTDYMLDVTWYEGPVFAIDIQLEEITADVTLFPAAMVPEQLAYVMYTSGSTGKPKGVMVKQSSVIRLVRPANYITITSSDHILSLSNFSFDGSVFDIFGALLNGAAVCILPKEQFLDFQALAEVITEQHITSFFLTTALFNSLVDTGFSPFSQLKYVLFGGERVSISHVRKFRAAYPGIQLVHVYGPTENTTFSSYKAVGAIPEDMFTLPIGSGISNSQCYILSEAGQEVPLVPIGVTGEICVGGAGLAVGYLNQPALTAEKFVSNPFKPGEKIYRTGDLGRWLRDGSIEFIGRRDAQVKIRGHRIELGEIESVVRGFDAVDASIVVVKPDTAGEQVIVAYIAMKENLNMANLRAYLSNSLPAYMIPAHFVQVAELPINSNGKIDLKRLPAWEGDTASGSAQYVAPVTPAQEKLVSIWREILGKDKIGIRDDFFELGGHSLKVTRLASQVHKVFDVKIELKDFFHHTILEEQAAVIAQAVTATYQAIPLLPEQDGYELSSSQRRLWVLSQFEEGNVAYNIPGAYIFEGVLQRDALTYAFQALMARHESLTTVFRADGSGVVKQYIQPEKALIFNIIYTDLRGADQQEDKVNAQVQAAVMRPFDLASGPLLYAELLQVADHKWVFVYVMHHIISDGWSMGILIEELLQFYHQYTQGNLEPKQPLRIQYKEYAAWQQAALYNGEFAAQRNYWLQQFSGVLPVPDLAGDRLRPLVKTYRGGMVEWQIDAALTEGLKELGKAQGATLFMGLMALVNALLYRYTQQEDMIIGSQIAGREHADLEGQIGCYLNTLALRTRFKGSDNFMQLLDQVKEVSLDAFANQAYPFDELVDALQLQHDMSRNPLFDVTVVLQNTSPGNQQELLELGSLNAGPYLQAEMEISKFDLSFNFIEVSGGIQSTIVYNSDIFDKVTIERMALHTTQLLTAINAHPHTAINALPYLNAAEERQLTVDFNPAAIAWPAEETIVSLFGAQVKKTPDKTAFVYEDKEFTYLQLQEMSGRVAGYLQARGIAADDLVGIILDRSEWLLVAILGILKAGGAYVPIDPDFPLARKSFILEDTGAKVVITQSDYLFDLPDFEAHIFAIDLQFEELEKSAPALTVPLNAGHLAYVMYTSGSTGTPKGVMVEHQNVIRLVKSANFITLTGKEVLLSTGAVSFDATTFEYWSMLLNGGTLVLCDKDTLLDTQLLRACIETKKVDTMWFTAGWFNQLADKDIAVFKGLKTILVGGDKLSVVHVQAVRKEYPLLQLINGYGPTENTTFSLTYAIPAVFEMIPVGKPISNSTAYVLDPQGLLCPVGVAGEICVGGAGLARGYLNNPELTAEKFVSSQFLHGQRLYKTGDLGRWLPDGNIEFIGRKDAQVKIRGYRIELGEVEKALQHHPDISAAVVTAKTTVTGEKELAGYVVSKLDLNVSVLTTYLSGILPAYMVPAHFIQLDVMPLTPNGKVDIRQLPGPGDLQMETGTAYVAARNATEEKLVEIWQEILGKTMIGVKDNFFDLGGHSLKATRLATQIHRLFDVKVSLSDLFTHLTLEEQAALIVQSGKADYVFIPPVSGQTSYPLSSSQRRLWILSQFDESNIAYNMPMVHVFEGVLDVQSLIYAFDALIDRHESLRTVFKDDGTGTVKQFILPEIAAGLVFRDIRIREDREELVQKWVSEIAIQPFNLATGPLLLASLYQIEDHKWIFVYSMHHIISDGWSMGILIHELLTLYNAHLHGSEITLKPLRIHYKDYAVWQQEQLHEAVFKTHEAYWLRQFEGTLPVLGLTGDMSRPAVKTYRGKVIERSLPAALSNSIKQFTREQGSTLFMGLVSLVNTLLFRYTGQEDMIIGTPVAGRSHADLEGQIGCYLNTLALRTRFSGEDNFSGLLQQVRTITMEAFAHQDYPFDHLIDQLSLVRDTSRSALFDVMVILQNNDTGYEQALEQDLEELKITPWPEITQVSKFDLLFSFAEAGDEINLGIAYNSDIFYPETAVRMADHLEQLLAAVMGSPEQPIKDLEYLSAAERLQLLTSFNDTAVVYEQEATLVTLFERQAAATPDHIALVFENNTWTYRSLQETVNQLAHYLRLNYDIRPDDLIGVQLERSEWMIIAILAVLKSGGAYVPVDPQYPQERIDYIVKDSQCKVLINIAEIGMFRASAHLYPTANLPVISHARNLAYVIYTSGSTGQPKGCMLEHRGVVNRLAWMWSAYGFTAEDVILQKTTFTFDVSVWEIFLPLCHGAKMVLCTRDDIASPAHILSLIEQQQVTCLHFVPGMLNTFMVALFGQPGISQQLHSLRLLITSGEALLPETVQAWYRKVNIPLHNLYGPTEASVDVTYYATQKADTSIPIGRPVWNTQLYILGPENQLMPIGMTGEICIGGDGLARGYLHNPVLTAEKFVPDPYRPGARLYRTGDIGKWLPDGDIAYIGRLDDQVKIRGYRIELGEIESILQTHPAVKGAVVLAKTDTAGEKELIAYVISDAELNTITLREYLGKSLPAYMVPAYYVRVSEFPRTASGKIDRKQLPALAGVAMNTGKIYVAARNETEEQLTEIWQEILGHEPVSVTDDFYEIGGNSLKATRLAGRIHQVFDTRIGLKELFLYTTPEEQARLILESSTSAYFNIPSTTQQPDYELSPAQRRLWLLSHFDEANMAYNMPGAYVLDGALDKDALTHAFQELIIRHESLRTVFKEDEDGKIKQLILLPEASGFEISYHDLRHEKDQQQVVLRLLNDDFTKAFDLKAGGLIRAGLLQLADDKWILAYVMHHIISDGRSVGILIRELLQLYNAHLSDIPDPLPLLSLQYKDYAAWQLKQLSGEQLLNHQSYWLRQLEGPLPVLAFPEDKLRPAIKTYNGGTVTRHISEAVMERVKVLFRKQESTLFMGLFAVLNTLLYRYTEQEDIIIGSPMLGREHADLEHQIGFYINTVALRTQFRGENSFTELLGLVKQLILDSYEHQLYPFDELVELLALPRDMSRHALFDVLMVLQDNELTNPLSQKAMEGLEVSEYVVENKTAKFDLAFNFAETAGGLQMQIAYNSDIYLENSINRLADHFLQLMEAVVLQPDIPLHAIDYLNAEEKNWLLHNCNDIPVNYPGGLTLPFLVETQALLTPDHTSIVFEDRSLSYQELRESSNQLANYLHQKYGVRENDLVGIKLERSEWLIIVMLGIWKSGGAYLPLDIEYPDDRIGFMVEDSNCRIVIDKHELECFMQEAQVYSKVAPEITINPQSLSYVIYTSGSTGRPKGVMIEHQAVANTILGHQEIFKLQGHERGLQFASCSFDASIFEIFAILTSGGTLFLVNEETKHNPAQLEEYVTVNSIDFALIPPAYLQLLRAEKMQSIKILITGGEPAIVSSVKEFVPYCNYYNAYGPTEISICGIIFRIEKGAEVLHQQIPIGKPIAGMQIYVLDKHLHLLPAGAVGEIYIGGAGLAKGYLNQEILTAKRFTPNPFNPEERIYKTGDMGKWLPDGNVLYTGRNDDQVKIRGYRIEPGEIESVLHSHTGIDAAIVIAKTMQNGEKELIGYLVGDDSLTTVEVQKYLSDKVPAYMIPGYFIKLAALPIAVNGKIDKEQLPQPEGLEMQTGVPYVAPRNETEEKLTDIWKEILDRETIGVKDDFFRIGGHSLKATLLISRIRKNFQVNVSLSALFSNPTIESIASEIDKVNWANNEMLEMEDGESISI